MVSFKKFVCLLVILGLFAASFAQTPGSDAPQADTPEFNTPEANSPEADEVERSFEFNYGSDHIEIRIHLRSGEDESELRHELIAIDSGAEFRVEFQQKAGDVENQLRMRLRLFELIEYVPDATPGYQNEAIVNSYSNWNWGNGFIDTTPNDATSKVYTLKTADNVFAITIRVNRPADGSLSLNPEDVKFDIEFNADAMRAAGWLNGTEVALKAVLASRLESEREHEDDSTVTENSVSVGASGASQNGQLFLSWVNYVQCDTNKVDVISSMHVDDSQLESDDDEGSTASVVAFAFINMNAQSNTACLWDPAVGAGRAPTSASGAASVVVSLAAFATAMVALF